MLKTTFLTEFTDNLLAEVDSEVSRILNTVNQRLNSDEVCTCMTGKGTFPKLDAIVHDNHYEIRASVPGFELSELEAEITDTEEGRPILTIRGKKMTPAISCTCARTVINEIKQSQFSRSIILPAGEYTVQNAHLDKGILTIELPKPEKQKPKKIKIDLK